MSGLYGEYIKTSQPSSLNFWRVIKDVCGRALSWWKTTPFLLINSGRFFSIAWRNLSSCSQYSTELMSVKFDRAITVHNELFPSSPTIHTA